MKVTKQWDYEQFGRRLRRARMEKLPVMSQRELAEKLGVTQSMLSRWSNEEPGVSAPTLDECAVIADLFDEFDFIELAKSCGRWTDDLERKILVTLARSGSAPTLDIPRYLKPLPAFVLGENVIPLPTGRVLQRVA